MIRPALTLAVILLTAGGAVAQPPKGLRPRPDKPEFVPGFRTLLTSNSAWRGGHLAQWSLLRNGRRDSVSLVMAVAPKARAWVKVAPVLKEGPARSTYVQGPCQDAMAVVNGSFFYQDQRGSRPMGLVRVNGQTAQGPSPRTSGGFLTSDGRSIRIVLKAQPQKAMAARFAVESAPILIWNGKNGMRSDDRQRHDRVGVGITQDGDILVVGAFGPAAAGVSLWEFEKLVRQAAIVQGERMIDFIALDGGPSAHLYTPNANGKGGGLWGQLGRIYTPNVVCVGVRPA